MNLMRQRDDLTAAFKAGAISKEQLDMALDAPVFQWHAGERSMSDTDWQFLTDNLLEEFNIQCGGPDKPAGVTYFPKLTPYECFRISHMDATIYEQWWIGEDKMLCFRCDDGYSHEMVRMWTVHSTNKGSAHYKLWMWLNGEKVDLNKPRLRAGRVEMLSNPQEITRFAGQPMMVMAYFLLDIYSQFSQVVKVTPDQPAKSVQWRKAHEHYLVIHRKIAESMASGKKPNNIDQVLLRSAHWRRAHLRRLQSNRFINKRGLIVPVKKAWVGPEEWKGKDGKIYTVVGFSVDNR